MTTNDSKAHLNDGKRLWIIRRKNGKSQEEMALEFEISVGTVANYEKARTEMPPSFWRAVRTKYHANPVPEDPETNPKLVLEEIPTLPFVVVGQSPRTFAMKVRLLRKKSIYLRGNMYSPFRRKLSDTMNFLYSTATCIFACEYLRFNFAFGGDDPSLYHNILFIGSFTVIAVLSIPVLLSIPWGTEFRMNNGI